LPDNAFANDGQLTKRDVRAITISALSPSSGQLLWDVGSGCGSVAIEWMRCSRGCEAIAFEEEAGRVQLIRQNAAALGVPRLKIVPGRVPDTFEGQRHPHAVFLGGGVSNPGLIEQCWEVLLPGGRIVANSVTLEGERRLIEAHDKLGGDMVRIDLSGLERIGEYRVMRPRMGVLQWRAAKPW
jgi:precorrin-6Y C5,15-methyltransferase (decarboxylating)